MTQKSQEEKKNNTDLSTLEEFLAGIKKKNEELRKKNGIAEPDDEFMASPEWIQKNRLYYSYNGSNFHNLKDI